MSDAPLQAFTTDELLTFSRKVRVTFSVDYEDASTIEGELYAAHPVSDERVATLATARGYIWRDGLDDWATFFEFMDGLDMDITSVIEPMKQMVDDEEFFFGQLGAVGRVVVLDAVEVPEEFRGHRFGSLIAAHTIREAGAGSMGTFVGAIAGDREKRPGILERATSILRSIGLEKFDDTELWWSTHDTAESDDALRAALQLNTLVVG